MYHRRPQQLCQTLLCFTRALAVNAFSAAGDGQDCVGQQGVTRTHHDIELRQLRTAPGRDIDFAVYNHRYQQAITGDLEHKVQGTSHGAPFKTQKKDRIAAGVKVEGSTLVLSGGEPVPVHDSAKDV